MRQTAAKFLRVARASIPLVVILAACNDVPERLAGPDAPGPSNPSAPSQPPGSAPPISPHDALPGLIVSDPTPPDAGSRASRRAEEMVYVSLSPGALADGLYIRLSNATTSTGTSVLIPVVDGGWDPVAVVASVGDELRLEVLTGGGGSRVAMAIVPAERRPAIVRIFPPADGINVPLDTRPRVVFSEPVDPSTLASGVGLTNSRSSSPVPGPVAASPWIWRTRPGCPTGDSHSFGTATSGPWVSMGRVSRS